MPFNTAHGLDTPRGEHWDTRAACRHDPEIFILAEGSGHRVDPAASHICLTHCPVLAECRAYADGQDPNDRHSMVLGGVVYTSKGAPASPQPMIAPFCRWCPPRTRIAPVRHGNLRAVEWHRRIGTRPCGMCRKAIRQQQQRLEREKANIDGGEFPQHQPPSRGKLDRHG